MNNVWKLAVFIAAELVLTQMISLIFRMISRRNKGVHLRYAKSAINVTIIVVGVYSLAQQFDITKDISKVLLQSGSLIVAIATFAAQQALGNIISGFSLSMSKPYEVEDKIKVVQGGGIIAEGIVQDITIRHTIIRQFNGESCIVPNSVMDASVITNTNYTENIGNFMEIEIGYSADIDRAMDIMQKICINHELTLNTESNKVFIKGYTQNGMILKTTVWTGNLDDSFRACSDIRAELVKEFLKNDIEIPYQTVTIYNEQEIDK
ncbi:MAG: mechanosensitive ion channel family protein [Lachnospiraceae bacterium]|jgi:small-conductance mechanosensitive channel|nr:mechanosensitive ion channel family protein [Lachnospiraceae bacterium]